jgi:TrmH family RNA methyltransferase
MPVLFSFNATIEFEPLSAVRCQEKKMITSRQNPKIKQIRKLNSGAKHRAQSGIYAVEGIRLLEEAQQSDHNPEWVIHTSGLDQRAGKLLENYQAQGILCEEVTPEVMEAASDTQTPQGVLAVFPQRHQPFPAPSSLVVILDSLSDPGNLGTLMRTCLAAGVDGLLLSPGCVDPFSPKVLRGGMGAHFKLPFRVAGWEEIEALTKDLSVLLADMDGSNSLWETDLTIPIAIILGSEAHGPSNEARSLAKRTIHIPMHAGTESLNAALAGGVLLFEAYRQRSAADQSS